MFHVKHSGKRLQIGALSWQLREDVLESLAGEVGSSSPLGWAGDSQFAALKLNRCESCRRRVAKRTGRSSRRDRTAWTLESGALETALIRAGGPSTPGSRSTRWEAERAAFAASVIDPEKSATIHAARGQEERRQPVKARKRTPALGQSVESRPLRPRPCFTGPQEGLFAEAY